MKSNNFVSLFIKYYIPVKTDNGASQLIKRNAVGIGGRQDCSFFVEQTSSGRHPIITKFRE